MLCCVCLFQNPELMGIFDDKNQELNIAEIIHQHFWFKPMPNNVNASQICTICWHKIKDFHEFYETVEKSHKQLQQHSDINEEEMPCSSAIKQEQEEFEEYLMQVKVEIDIDQSNEQAETAKLKALEAERNVNDNDDEKSDSESSSPGAYVHSGICDGDSSSDEPVFKEKKPKIVKTVNKVKNIKKNPKKQTENSTNSLQIQNKSRNTKASNICPVCTKEIRDKQAYEKHVRLHFESSGPRIKCPREGCESWLKDEDNLKQHLRRFHNQPKYECPECYRICKNKHSLTCHVRNTHSKIIHSCEECQKTFKSALSLKEHMAAHTGEPLYSCPFCTRTFNSKANMYSHKKKAHPVEWDLHNKSKMGF